MMKIVGVAACTSGIAHTYIAKQKLEKAAKALGHTVHIETQGTIGTEDELTMEEIKDLAQVERTPDQVKEIARGGYVLKDSGGKPDIILIATGSEMEITLQAAEKLAGEGRNVRVVSLPSTDIFDAQDEKYRESVLPSNVSVRVAVEAGIADYWYKYVGLKGAIVGMTGYGESAPADKLFPFFGFTAENIVAKAHKVLGVKGA